MATSTQANATATAKKATVKTLTVADFDSAINAGNLANVEKVDLQRFLQKELLPVATVEAKDRTLDSDFADIRIKRLVQQLNKAAKIDPSKRTEYQKHVAGLQDHLASSLSKADADYMRIVKSIQYRRNGF